MTKFNGKKTLKLLLIITMMVQPMAFSYAMASMDHTDHPVSTPTEQGHRQHHAMHGNASVSQQQNHDNGAGTSNDCCNNAMCCAAIMVETEVISFIPNDAFSSFHSSSWEGINLSAESKPPRNIHG